MSGAAQQSLRRPLLTCGVRYRQATNKRGKETFYTAARFVLATGERPRYLGVPGDKEHGITRWERREA